MYCISIYLCISLNKSLDLFCIFLGKYKEMGDGSRLLHSIVRHSGPHIICFPTLPPILKEKIAVESEISSEATKLMSFSYMKLQASSRKRRKEKFYSQNTKRHDICAWIYCTVYLMVCEGNPQHCALFTNQESKAGSFRGD